MTAPGLCALVSSRGRLYAWPATDIDHLAAPSELSGSTVANVVLGRETHWVTFDLAVLLGDAPAPAQAGSYVMSRLPYCGTRVPVAVRVDACLAIRRLRSANLMPDALLSHQGLAYQGLFTPDDVEGNFQQDQVGYVLEPEGLLGFETGEGALEALRRAGARGA